MHDLYPHIAPDSCRILRTSIRRTSTGVWLLHSVFLAALVLIAFQVSLAQSPVTQKLNNSRLNYYTSPGASIDLDSLLIVPGTVIVRDLDKNEVYGSDRYDVDEAKAELRFHSEPPDRISVFYRVFPSYLSERTSNKRIENVFDTEKGFMIQSMVYDVHPAEFEYLDFGKLDYTGSFTRGISFGNGQDLVLNSGMNLTLSGMLTDEIEIKAVITDNQVPIQPEGNTQNLREFDQVFIQLSKEQHRLTVGDFFLASPESQFLNFNRKLQGANYAGSFDLDESISLDASAGYAMNRGTFAQKDIRAVEGNQGPYKLEGGNGETFIVVLAGTERVYINGELMQRGATADYTIDYNTGEVTFTPHRLITEDLRIRVEFEYSDRTYLRSLMHANTTFRSGKWQVGLNLFSEGDNKHQRVDDDLSPRERQRLEAIGDDIASAFVPGIDSQAYTPARIRYELIDSTVGGLSYDSVFSYSTDPLRAHYVLSFTFVGLGNGNYEPLSSNANGRVYAWKAPVGGQPAGSYEPIVRLIAPKRSQMYNLTSSVAVNESTSIVAELALSNNDVNTFSELGNSDNQGVAGTIGIRNGLQKTDAKGRQHRLTSQVQYQYVDRKFEQIDRFRAVEFDRDWNLGEQTGRDHEHSSTMSVDYAMNNQFGLNYALGTLHRGSNYSGFDHRVKAFFRHHGFSARAFANYLDATSTTGRSGFFRPGYHVEQTFSSLGGWKVGARGLQEINRTYDVVTEALSPASFFNQDYQFYLASPDTAANRYGFDVALRYEHAPNSGDFTKPVKRGRTYRAHGSLGSNPGHQLNWDLTYRNTYHSANGEIPAEGEHFYLGRLDHQLNVLKGFIRTSTLYELGSGREQKKQVSYQQVEAGQGQYQWLDDGDGVRELDEFVLSPFTDQNDHIRVMVATAEFVAVNQTRFNQLISIDPSRRWKHAGGILKHLSKFSLSSTIQLDHRRYSDDQNSFIGSVNPFAFHTPDSLLVGIATVSRNTLFFNRAGRAFSAEVRLNYNQNKNLLTNGFESYRLQSQGFGFRWNFYRSVAILFKYDNGVRSNFSDFYTNNRYRVLFNETESSLSWLYRRKLRLTLMHEYAFRSNTRSASGKGYAVSNQLTASCRYSALSKGNVEAQFTVADVGYSAAQEGSNQSEFALLNGLKPGTNYLWNVSFNRKIGKVLQLTLIYDGRKTGEGSNMVHVGRAQVSALF